MCFAGRARIRGVFVAVRGNGSVCPAVDWRGEHVNREHS